MKKLSPYRFADLSEEIQKKARKGDDYCSTCGHRIIMYSKALGKQTALLLIKLYKAHQRFGDDRFFTTRELYPRDNKSSTEGITARFWGLIEIAESTNSIGAPAGAYKLTDLGRRFVMGLQRVPSHAITYNNELLRLDGRKMTDIRQALGKKIDFDEIMREV